jgi:hypothetical protein
MDVSVVVGGTKQRNETVSDCTFSRHSKHIGSMQSVCLLLSVCPEFQTRRSYDAAKS